jgi:hypothetical protein
VSWTLYPLGLLNDSLGPPLAASDGNIWVASIGAPGGGPYTVDFALQTPGGGAPTKFSAGLTGNIIENCSNLVTDGTYVAVALSNSYPRSGALVIDIATHAETGGSDTTTSFYGTIGAVAVGSTIYAFGGNTNYPESWQWPMPAATLANLNTYTNGAPALGCPCEDGTNFWAPQMGTTTLYEVPIATFGANTFTPRTMAGAALTGGPQTGFDGRFFYLACAAGGVIIFDTANPTSPGVVVNAATSVVNCYYSANLNKVVLDDTAGNIYTMAPGAGGGALTNIGNANTITGEAVTNEGFGDGPHAQLWASAHNPASTHNYLYSFPGVTGQPIRLLV